MALLKKMQEMQIIAAGTVSDLRILSYATAPEKPIPTHNFMKLLFALLIGLGLGSLISIALRAFHRKIEDPRWVEHMLNIPTAAMIPHSKVQHHNSQLYEKGLSNKLAVLAEIAPHDMAIEGLRSLRTGMQFTLEPRKNNIISVIGISPSIGKSFISCNFAHILADAGLRVLLIDGDLRRSKLKY